MYSDNGDEAFLYEVLGFNLNYRIGFLYRLDTYKKMPVVMYKWDQVISAVKDGKSFQPISYPVEPIPIDNVYAFMVKDKNNLLNITYKIREELRKQTSY